MTRGFEPLAFGLRPRFALRMTLALATCTGMTACSRGNRQLVLPRGLGLSDRGYVVADSGNHRIVLVSRDVEE